MPKSTKKYNIVTAEVCNCCYYYCRHYVFLPNGRPLALWYGHCRYPRKAVCPPDHTCLHWKQRPAGFCPPDQNPEAPVT